MAPDNCITSAANIHQKRCIKQNCVNNMKIQFKGGFSSFCNKVNPEHAKFELQSRAHCNTSTCIIKIALKIA